MSHGIPYLHFILRVQIKINNVRDHVNPIIHIQLNENARVVARAFSASPVKKQASRLSFIRIPIKVYAFSDRQRVSRKASFSARLARIYRFWRELRLFDRRNIRPVRRFMGFHAPPTPVTHAEYTQARTLCGYIDRCTFARVPRRILDLSNFSHLTIYYFSLSRYWCWSNKIIRPELQQVDKYK